MTSGFHLHLFLSPSLVCCSSLDIYSYLLQLGFSESNSQQLSKATSSHVIKPETIQIQKMDAHQYSAVRESDMSLEDMIQNGTVTISKLTKIDRSLDAIAKIIGISNICKIRLYGREGVGKTTLIKVLQDQPLVRNMFECVIWVTIPNVWNLKEMQLQISTQIPLAQKVYKNHINSSRLYNLLEEMKFLLIVDDVH